MRRLALLVLPVLLLVASATPADAHNRPRVATAQQQESIRVIRSIWPAASVERAIRIARCESDLNPRAKSRHSSAVGLFQLLTSVHGRRARAMGNWPLTDATKNTRAALDLYKRSGWRPWVCR